MTMISLACTRAGLAGIGIAAVSVTAASASTSGERAVPDLVDGP